MNRGSAGYGMSGRGRSVVLEISNGKAKRDRSNAKLENALVTSGECSDAES